MSKIPLASTNLRGSGGSLANKWLVALTISPFPRPFFRLLIDRHSAQSAISGARLSYRFVGVTAVRANDLFAVTVEWLVGHVVIWLIAWLFALVFLPPAQLHIANRERLASLECFFHKCPLAVVRGTNG